ncbi:MAG: TlyA family RNA methyltransferase [Oscillospiraceae bacterium]|nr:TlyA family RNA methyltransferase [Oscillospiraceae bacterium]
MPKEKLRLDLLLAQKEMFPSREKARGAIMSGKVFVNGIKQDKCGCLVKITDDVVFLGEKIPYVSRGGLKLEKAIKDFKINLNGKICIDIGASTGGFTDCMLQNGAKKVYSIDVGYGQLAWSLRCDPRVIVMERTNIRYISCDKFSEKADFASVDVSFISLKKVIPKAVELMENQFEIITLVKPQFEAGRGLVSKKGVIKDKNVHRAVLIDYYNFIKSLGLFVKDVSFSPIKGPEGNIEFLFYICNEIIEDKDMSFVLEIVEKAHGELDG